MNLSYTEDPPSNSIASVGRHSWRHKLAMLWVVLAIPVIPAALVSIIAFGLLHVLTTELIIWLSLPIFLAVGAADGLKKPHSSWLVLLPFPVLLLTLVVELT